MKVAPAEFLGAASPEERQEQKQTVLLANATITYSVLQAVRHVFGAHGADVLRSMGVPAMEMEIQLALEGAVEKAYYAGVKHGLQVGADGQEALMRLGSLGPTGLGVHPSAPSDKHRP